VYHIAFFNGLIGLSPLGKKNFYSMYCLLFWPGKTESVKFLDVHPVAQQGNGTKYVADTGELNDRFDV